MESIHLVNIKQEKFEFENGDGDLDGEASASDIVDNTEEVEKTSGRREELIFVAIKQEQEYEDDQSIEGDENDNICIKSSRLICLRCGSGFDDRSVLAEHVEVCESMPDRVTKSELLKINEPLVEIDIQDDDILDIAESSKNYKCPVCERTYVYKCNLITHMMSHKLYRCPTCQKVFFFQYHLDRHISLHRMSKEYVCHVCGNGFNEKIELIAHLKIHNSEEMFKCTSCDKTFGTKLFLDRHAKIHKSEDNYSCLTCGRSYKLKCHLKRHMKCHLLEQEYIMGTGTALYKMEKNRMPCAKRLNKPVNDATGGDVRVKTHKRYICELCHKEYTQKAHLARHKVQHSENPFGCELCDRIFKCKESVDEHMNMHLLGTQHICQLCNKKYPNKESLNRHVNTHTEERLYPCKFCSRRFNDKSNLNKHMRIHTSDKRYQCKHCDKNFLQKVHLNRHIMNVHILQKSLMRSKLVPGKITTVYMRVDNDD